MSFVSVYRGIRKPGLLPSVAFWVLFPQPRVGIQRDTPIIRLDYNTS